MFQRMTQPGFGLQTAEEGREGAEVAAGLGRQGLGSAVSPKQVFDGGKWGK